MTQTTWFPQLVRRLSVGLLLTVALGLMHCHETSAGVLKSLYSFDGASPLADGSGNGYTLTNNGVTFSAPTDSGAFLLGSTVGNYSSGQSLVIPAEVYAAGDDFTFTAMVRTNTPEDATRHRTMLSTSRFRFQYRPATVGDNVGEYRFESKTPAQTFATGADVFRMDQWYFVALTYNAATKRVEGYLQDDGEVFGGAKLSGITSAGLDDMTNFRLGTNISGIGGADAWIGQIDGVRFYQGALTKKELREVFREYHPTAGSLFGKFGHEGANPLSDDTGSGNTLSNGGGVSFVAPPEPSVFDVGEKVGAYHPGVPSGYLDVPNFYTPGHDFTFLALVRSDGDPVTSHQTIFSSERFRFQFTPGTLNDGKGSLVMDIKGHGAVSSTYGAFLNDSWYFVALRYNTSTRLVEAFLDDGRDRTLGTPMLSFTAATAGLMDEISRFRIGADGLSGLGNFDTFRGWIDGVQIYDRLLSDVELRQLFAADYLAAVPEPGTVALGLLGALGLVVVAWRHRCCAK